MLVISYYTPDYADHAQRLAASCAAHGLRFWIEPAEDLGQWAWNCARKPAFVLRALKSCGESVLWIDADAAIMRPLDMPEDADLAAFLHRKHFEARCGHRHGPKDDCPHDRMKMQSGTVLVRPSKAGLALVENWLERCQASPDEWDQAHLYRAWRDLGDVVRFEPLDLSYCYRFDEPDPLDEPHIVHYQESRQRRMRDRMAQAKDREIARGAGQPWVEPRCPEITR